jgi:hypothetical protein
MKINFKIKVKTTIIFTMKCHRSRRLDAAEDEKKTIKISILVHALSTAVVWNDYCTCPYCCYNVNASKNSICIIFCVSNCICNYYMCSSCIDISGCSSGGGSI